MKSRGNAVRTGRPRRDATIVRFRADRLPTGLYRHHAVKLIVTLKGEQTSVRWNTSRPGSL